MGKLRRKLQAQLRNGCLEEELRQLTVPRRAVKTLNLMVELQVGVDMT